MRKFCLTLYLTCITLCASAQLHFLSADSVVTWDNDAANLRNTALQASPHLRAQQISATRDELPALQTAWEKQMQKGDAMYSAYNVARNFTLAAQLLALTADAQYALAMEHLIYGPALEAAMSPTLNAEKITAAQTLLNAVGTLYATQGDTVYVNLYSNSTSLISHSEGEFQLDLITGMPFHERIKLRLSRTTNPQGLKITFCLRLPYGEWNDETFPIYCNGHETPYRIEKGYAVITNTWHSGYEIYFDYPQPLLELQ